MDTSAPPPPPPNDAPNSSDTKSDAVGEGAAAVPASGADVEMAPAVEEEEPLPEEILNASPDEIMTRVRLIDNDLKVSSPS